MVRNHTGLPLMLVFVMYSQRVASGEMLTTPVRGRSPSGESPKKWLGARLGIEGIDGEKPERCAVIFHILIADDEDMIGRPVIGGDAAAVLSLL